jgi:hypothetical protein
MIFCSGWSKTRFNGMLSMGEDGNESVREGLGGRSHCLITWTFFDFICLGLAVHLLGKDLIYGLDNQVYPFTLMAAGIERLVAGFALLPGRRGPPSWHSHHLPYLFIKR